MGSKQKERGDRCSDSQKLKLVQYMLAHREFERRKCDGKAESVSKSLSAEWEQLAATLNAIEGPVKTVVQWQKAWRDTKLRVKKKKASDLQVQRTKLDMTIDEIMRPVQVDGIPGTVESMPESETAVQRVMTAHQSSANKGNPIGVVEAGGSGHPGEDEDVHGDIGSQSQDDHVVARAAEGSSDSGPEFERRSSSSVTPLSSPADDNHPTCSQSPGPSTSRIPAADSSSSSVDTGTTLRIPLQMMAQAQLLTAKAQVRQCDQQKEMIEEFKKIGANLDRLTTSLEMITRHMSK